LNICVGSFGALILRYAGLEKNDESNIDKVLKKLEGKTKRKAQFVCVPFFLSYLLTF
jgi:XTP/dITP diphosphohydrolase